jgi:T-complex protein 1 subunit zeta
MLVVKQLLTFFLSAVVLHKITAAILIRFSGFDSQEVIVKLLSEAHDVGGPIGIDCSSGEAINPGDAGIYDNYNVKRQMIHSCTVIACNLLLVDEIMRAGLSSLKGGQ